MFSELELNKNDPPDLVDEKSNIGIEVVRAIENEDAELSNAFATYRNKHISSVPDKLKKKITLGFKGLVCDNDGIIIGANFGVKDNLYKTIEERIQAKSKRLNAIGHLKLNTNGLFIYNSHGFCFENDLNALLHKLSNNYANIKLFDFIIIYCSHEVWYCDIKLQSISCRRLNDRQIEALKKETLEAIGRAKEYSGKLYFISD